MKKRGTRCAAWLVPGAMAIGLMIPAPVGAQVPVRKSGQFQINSYTTNHQLSPSVASDSDGNFVVVWWSYGSSETDTSAASIQGQRYASSGSTLGAQFQINTYTVGNQQYPSVAAAADGGFFVVWQGFSSPGNDPISSVHGRRFASDGSPQGADFQVNTYTTSAQQYPAVAADADGDVVVVWQSDGSFGSDTSIWSIQGQRYASGGSPQGAQFQINTYTTSDQIAPSVAMDANGSFVVAWQSIGSPGTDTSNRSIQGQRFTSSGSLQGAQFQVNTYTTGGQFSPSGAMDADGDFVIVWESFMAAGSDNGSPNGDSIQGQRYASSGLPQAAQFQINTYTTRRQVNPSIASDSDGDFVVVWDSSGSFDSDTSFTSAQGQRYASDGSPQSTEFQVNTYTTGFQQIADVAAEADGEFVVVWGSSQGAGADSSGSSVQGQLYRLISPVPAMSTATRFALAVGLLLGATHALRRRT